MCVCVRVCVWVGGWVCGGSAFALSNQETIEDLTKRFLKKFNITLNKLGERVKYGGLHYDKFVAIQNSVRAVRHNKPTLLMI